MAYNFTGGGDEDQVFLMPPDPRDWLPEGHLAWAMRRAAAGLDLAPFLAAYRADGQGKTAYHPRTMVALVMYCYAKGIRSSRAVEMATFDDVGARVICAGLHPDHARNARFVSRHEEPLTGLLVQSLDACGREGLVGVGSTAGGDAGPPRGGAGEGGSGRRGRRGAGGGGAGGAEREAGRGEGPAGGPGRAGAGQGPGQGRPARPARSGGRGRAGPAAARPRPL